MPARPLLRPPRGAAITLALLLGAVSVGSCSSPHPDCDSPTTAVVKVAVPGVGADVIVPCGWDTRIQGAADGGQELIVRAPNATGELGFRTNVVLREGPATRSLQDEGTAALAAADALWGWELAATGPGMTEKAGHPAFGLTGSYYGQTGPVVQNVIIIDITDTEPHTYLYVTSSIPQEPITTTGGPAEFEEMLAEYKRSAAEAQSVIDSVTISAPGS